MYPSEMVPYEQLHQDLHYFRFQLLSFFGTVSANAEHQAEEQLPHSFFFMTVSGMSPFRFKLPYLFGVFPSLE